MTDRLEDFLKNNQEAFNDLEPSNAVWEKVAFRANAAQRPARKRIIYLSSAASAAVIAGIIIVLGIFQTPADNQFTAEQFPVINETEAFYIRQVNTQRQAVYHLTTQHPDLKKALDNDLAELDTVLLELKKDLNDNVANAQVVEAMIQNYRMKLTILEDIKGYLEQRENNDKKQTTYEL